MAAAAESSVPDWGRVGLNLCNCPALRLGFHFYTSASGPLFGAQVSATKRGFGFG